MIKICGGNFLIIIIINFHYVTPNKQQQQHQPSQLSDSSVYQLFDKVLKQYWDGNIDDYGELKKEEKTTRQGDGDESNFRKGESSH